MTKKKTPKLKAKAEEPEVETTNEPEVEIESTETTDELPPKARHEHEIHVLGLDEEGLAKVFKGIGKGAKVVFGEDIFHGSIRNLVIRVILGFVAGRSDVSFKVRPASALRVRSFKNAFGIPHNLDTENK